MIPVVLFAYARPQHLRQTLACLHENRVPLIYAFSDGPRTPEKTPAISEVRSILNAVDWCDLVLCERKGNLGLGNSILSGVTEVLANHEAVIVFEDDLVCVPGTYDYLCAALKHYRHDARVMSVTGWTHPLVTPVDVTDQPYFDGRAECLVWGTWRRAWLGMREDAKTLMNRCESAGIDVYRYGADLVGMAETELNRNIWAVRFLYWHMLNRALCLRPPWSMVEHIGFDSEGTNVTAELWIKNPPLRACASLPSRWPNPIEHPGCAELHQAVCGRGPIANNVFRRMYRFVRRLGSRLCPSWVK